MLRRVRSGRWCAADTRRVDARTFNAKKPDLSVVSDTTAAWVRTTGAAGRPRLDAAEGSSRPNVVGRRVGVHDPYARAKAMLVGGIAHADVCRVVWSEEFGFATVHGHPDYVDGVEELYTSLLVQELPPCSGRALGRTVTVAAAPPVSAAPSWSVSPCGSGRGWRRPTTRRSAGWRRREWWPWSRSSTHGPGRRKRR